MATTFTKRSRRTLSSAMFTDLGFPNVVVTLLEPPEVQFDFVEDLTPAQILACRIRLQTRDQEEENTLSGAVGALANLNTSISSLDAMILLGSRTNAQNTADIKALAQILRVDAQISRGLVKWVGRGLV